MVFSGFTPAGPQSVRLEESIDIRVVNPDISQGWVVCNGFCYPLRVDKTVANGWKLTYYGWMPGQCEDADLILLGDNGDIQTHSTYLTVTEPQAPFLPILEFLIQWLETEPTLKTYVKVAKIVRKPERFTTTRPQYLVVCPNAGVNFAQIGENDIQYDERISIMFIDDLRKAIRYERHETFIYKVVNYIRNNPTLSGNLGIVDTDVTDVKMPDERLENVYLHQSSVEMRVRVEPEYT